MNATTKLRKVRRYIGILGDTRWENVHAVSGITYCPCGYKKDNTPPALSEFVPMPEDGIWGTGNDSHAWFHFTLPAVGPDTYLYVGTERGGWDADNPQFIAYVNGVMRQGMDTNHRELLLAPDTPADVYLYAYTGPRVARAKLYCDVRTLNTDVNGLWYDLLYPNEVLNFQNHESDEYAKILDYLYKAVSMLDLFDLSDPAYFESVRQARTYMREEFYGKYCSERPTTTICIGHTHIDCAWLWTLDQTREKVQRSFSTVLELMDQYPEYKFMSSQALLYKDLKEEAPEVYEKVKARIREGRWECEGAMWVEADCNLSSGESLVRQVQYGKNFFRDEFGVESRVLWLPDVFGYAAALPQILKKSGVDWFVTSKISWNDVNRMPADLFSWKGIDGTAINAYFLTAQDDHGGPSGKGTTYVANTHPAQISGAYKRFQQKDLSSEAILTFGFGDGGGGPTADMLEYARRGAVGVPGCPNAKIGFAGDFLKRLEPTIENYPLLPVWQGELYLEFHRGTYTSQAHNKRNNRKSEFALLGTEQTSVMGKALLGTAFPKAQLHMLWEDVLTHQFHDIIPGSSIREVYAESDECYARVLGTAASLTDAVRAQVAASVAADEGWVVFNPGSFSGPAYVALDGRTVRVDDLAAKGYTVVKSFRDTNRVTLNGKTLDTDLFRVTFDDAWQIDSIYDKRAGREVLTGKGNELRLYMDYPDTYDAWEWQCYSQADTNYRTLTAFDSVEFVNDGARFGIRVVRPLSGSKLTQTMWFYDDLDKIDFETEVDWHRRHQMLKAAFPVDVNADHATYDIQFGTIERPTHFNTSWDETRFEVCAQKYADLSEGGYGVSLINDCKYGHDIHDGVIQLSLLRGPTYPDEEADQGHHVFTYALVPHVGSLNQADTVRLAYRLNDPAAALRAVGEKTTLPLSFSAVTVEGAAADHVVCETVKEAEYTDDTVIRLYECRGERAKTTVTLGIPAQKVYLADLSENILSELPVVDGRFEYEFRGFEIATFIVK